MHYADYHTHTHFSFDSEEAIEAACRAAISRGLQTIAITNHCDYDGIADGIYPEYPFAADRAEICAAKKKFEGKLRVLYGIELGQPQLYPDKWKEIQAEFAPEYVLGSLHNLEKVPDFAFLDFTDMAQSHIDNLLKRYFTELALLVQTPGLTTLAHLTYPVRYLKKRGRAVDLHPFYEQISGIFKTVIARALYLEVNTSGLRQGVGDTMPGKELIALYRECGGTRVIVGSDAHFARDIGASVVQITDQLAAFGFEHIGLDD